MDNTPKTDRNAEIGRRAVAGESGPSLARDYDISTNRVYEIIAAYRKANGIPAPRKRKRNPKPIRVEPAVMMGEPGPFSGTVTICPGYSVGRPLAFDLGMRLAAMRARAHQGPLIGMGRR